MILKFCAGEYQLHRTFHAAMLLHMAGCMHIHTCCQRRLSTCTRSQVQEPRPLPHIERAFVGASCISMPSAGMQGHTLGSPPRGHRQAWSAAAQGMGCGTSKPATSKEVSLLDTCRMGDMAILQLLQKAADGCSMPQDEQCRTCAGHIGYTSTCRQTEAPALPVSAEIALPARSAPRQGQAGCSGGAR